MYVGKKPIHTVYEQALDGIWDIDLGKVVNLSELSAFICTL